MFQFADLIHPLNEKERMGLKRRTCTGSAADEEVENATTGQDDEVEVKVPVVQKKKRKKGPKKTGHHVDVEVFEQRWAPHFDHTRQYTLLIHIYTYIYTCMCFVCLLNCFSSRACLPHAG